MRCPFCGVDSEVPHETQEMCIRALQAEIVRVRSLLDHSRPLQTGPAGPDTSDKHKEESALPASSEVKTRLGDEE